jgi:hypothetical protein
MFYERVRDGGVRVTHTDPHLTLQGVTAHAPTRDAKSRTLTSAPTRRAGLGAGAGPQEDAHERSRRTRHLASHDTWRGILGFWHSGTGDVT